MINVMIADDNVELNSSCLKFLTKDKDIKVVSCTFDGKSTLEEYVQTCPDILLLDLDMPKINGIELINILCLEEQERKKCNIIVISGDSEKRFKLYNTSKVYRIMPKPIDFDFLLSTIKEIALYSESNDLLKKRIKRLLTNFKLYTYSKGTTYLTDAIIIASQNPLYLKTIENLYTEIAFNYNVQSKQVKWSIRNSILQLNKNISENDLNKIFKIHDSRYTITPKFFLTNIIEYIKNENL